MKKRLSIAVLLFMLLFIQVASVQAAEIVSIDVEAIIHHDGSATMTEIWTTADVYEGTQISRIMDLPSSMGVHSLEVQSMDGTPFETVTDWQTRTTFEERAAHASILTTNTGYEIVWGITEQGDNRYVITYKLEGLVQGFNDGVSMHFDFVPAGITPTPSEVSLQLYASDFDLAQVEFELLGMTGDVAVTLEGAILAHSEVSFAEGDSLTLRAQFPDELFVPTVQNNANFNASDGNFSGVILVLILITATIIAITVVIMKIYMRMKLSDGTIKKWPSISEIPVKYRVPSNMNLPVIYYLITQPSPFYTKGVSSAFGAYLLKWSQEGIIDITKEKSRHIITLHPLQTNLSEIEHLLYEILENHVDHNQQLSSNDAKKWEEVMEKIHEWEKELYEQGAKELHARGVLIKGEKNKSYFTPTGYDELLEFWGFIKYLKEQHKENNLSQPFEYDHLVIATMAGLKKEMKKYFTQHINQSDDMFMIWQMMWMTQAFNRQAQAHYQNSDSSTGGGSFSAGSAAGGGGGGIS